MLTLIILGILGYPILLLAFQIWALILNNRKKENYFLFDFLPAMLGVEALGDAAPQTVLNGKITLYNI